MAEKHNPDKAMAGMLKRKGVWPAAAGGDACPDAATFAAYFEHSLSAAETSLWESHFSTCARCQEQLAALVRSEPASAAKLEYDKKPAFSWLWDWRFLAPVGAAAVALVFFISYQTMRAPMAPAGGELIAKREAPSQVPATVEPQKSLDSASKDLEKGRTASDEFRATKSATSANAARANQPLRDKGATHGEPGRATKSSAIASEKAASRALAKPAEENQLAASAGRVAPAQLPPAGIVGGAQQESAKSQQRIVELDRAQAVPAAPQVAAQQSAVVAEAKERTAQAQSENQLKGKMAANKQEGADAKRDAAGRERSETADARAAAAPRFGAKYLMAPGEFIVTTPNPKILWRFGASGLIERSGDAGKSWERQKISQQETFLSGSAPAEKVCWVGGKNGILLRTVDGGENWEAVPSPTQSAIVSIKARDGFHVTVTDADGYTYETPNAGRLWRAP